NAHIAIVFRGHPGGGPIVLHAMQTKKKTTVPTPKTMYDYTSESWGMSILTHRVGGAGSMFWVRLIASCQDAINRTRKCSLVDAEIKNLMQEWRSSKDHRDRDCFVCCILSHGESGLVYGTDEQEVPIRTIMSYFTARQCPQLAEKPKLFFIQACQGKEIQQAVYIEADAQNPDLLPIQQRVSPSESIPEEADFLLGMATVDGYASFRHIQHGTWYIQALCNKLLLLFLTLAFCAVPVGEEMGVTAESLLTKGRPKAKGLSTHKLALVFFNRCKLLRGHTSV
uniref:Caspase-8 n=1 Tax=Chelydra serpentina TaxID=8475 RepID=A0A8C3S2R3_CHESE